jgi:hypothetical protein
MPLVLRSFLLYAIALVALPALAATQVMVQDYEKSTAAPTVWVVNIPDQNASVELSGEHPQEGAHCLKLHYHFVAQGGFQYLGIPHKVRLDGPVHQLHFWLYGDKSNCSYGVQVADASGETHQFSKRFGQCGDIDFTGWKQIDLDLDQPHETWGGDKNGRIDFPITAITLTVGQPQPNGKQAAAEGNLYFDAITANSEARPRPQIAVTSPAYCSEIKGDTKIEIVAPFFKSVAAKCWQQGDKGGHDSLVATIALDAQNRGSFVFQADQYPHGPITVRLSADNGTAKDNCYLQLYNRGGVAWNAGIPKDPPPAAADMKLVFADDFTDVPSISSTDPKATYYDHKPPNGWQDFSDHRFAGHDSKENPFSQTDTYLRIRASDKTHRSGLICSLKNDSSGIAVRAPCYFECRFMGPNAIGTWPGYWLLTDCVQDDLKGKKSPCDELDIIEAYGGEGQHEPNAGDGYMITPHAWNQSGAAKQAGESAFKQLHNPIRMHKFGIGSTWYEAFHTYGCKITEAETIYYCDDIEVGRHPTLPESKRQRLYFLIDLATGGGWPVDLSRYGVADMWIDYVRVYAGK